MSNNEAQAPSSKLQAQSSNVECRKSHVPARLFYLETKDHAAKFSPEMKTDSDHKRTTHHAPWMSVNRVLGENNH